MFVLNISDRFTNLIIFLGVTYSISKFLGSYFDGSEPHTLPAIPGHPTQLELGKN